MREAHKRGAIVKVIFENDFMPGDAIKKKLCRISEKAGADFVKTSTGYGFVKGPDGKYSYQGATEHDLVLMRKAVSAKVQVKAAGGVRDLDALMHVRDLGTTRCGATATAAMLEEYKRRARAERCFGFFGFFGCFRCFGCARHRRLLNGRRPMAGLPVLPALRRRARRATGRGRAVSV